MGNVYLAEGLEENHKYAAGYRDGAASVKPALLPAPSQQPVPVVGLAIVASVVAAGWFAIGLAVGFVIWGL